MFPSASSTSQALIKSATLISQGAEARVYKAILVENSPPVLLKHRFQKQYRHPNLDTKLTKERVAGEARALLKCLRSGVSVPGVRYVDAIEGVLGIEWIEGTSVRKVLPGGAEEEDESDEVQDDQLAQHRPLPEEYGLNADELMRLIGIELAKMHAADIIHGDLTTSNMMLQRPAHQPTRLFLIDFGLSYQSTLVEDKAVDLYVLERAFASTHPESEPLFASVLQSYGEKLGPNKWGSIKNRLDDVRLRGRKRSMVG